MLVQILDPPNEETGKGVFFSHYLDISNCQKSEDDTFFIKNIDVLLENRNKDEIVLVDTNMHCYTVHLCLSDMRA